MHQFLCRSREGNKHSSSKASIIEHQGISNAAFNTERDTGTVKGGLYCHNVDLYNLYNLK